MKIEGINPAAAQLPVDNVAARVSSGAPASTQAAAQDWTSFHSDTTSVQSLTSQALNSPEVRQSTVDALRQAVNAVNTSWTRRRLLPPSATAIASEWQERQIRLVSASDTLLLGRACA